MLRPTSGGPGLLEVPMKRFPVNKAKSASSFRRAVSKTKAINVKGSQRGGIRL